VALESGLRVEAVTGSVPSVAYTPPGCGIDPVGDSFRGRLGVFRFVHAADIHLDSPLQGLERYPDAPVEAVRAAPRRAFEALVELAIDERVAFVLLAGDLYDGDWKDYNTGLFFVAQMRRLAEAGIRVFLVSGNHDAQSQITKRLTLPANVHHFASRAPETVELRDLDVAIHGQSFPERSVSTDLSAAYPAADAGRLDIGLLHTSLDGRPGHASYAPCTAAALRRKGYAYWALGHVHKREVVARDEGDPWIVFPGNLQGRHARETGAKGASLVTVEKGRVVDVAERALDRVRWARVEVDLARSERTDDALARIRLALRSAVDSAEGRLVAARVVLAGATKVHDELLRAPDRWVSETRSIASDVGGGAGVWIERLVFETRAQRDLAALLGREDALAGLLQRILRLEDEQLDLAPLAAELEDLKGKLPALGPGDAEPTGADAGLVGRIDPTDPDWLRARLPAVRDLLWARLVGEQAESP